ncbi:rla0 (nucleomorph) [Hemiselmis andersenii]|uniref:Rla0 n=1 Tax=Hemiselmis andersenii TaxID=464988 RepID=A9BKU6_HEMAN|nr:rla0 [Hemiselmis andersenii]ABW98101.1 rla0 [Hemiselmis andersenii]|mmetsp:Transcript_42124/g.98143  ORF Transcript_42124/g.98143 Transcript_42124/m.98143 type:complete len:310 (+) Transcript_42124:57-986(+)
MANLNQKSLYFEKLAFLFSKYPKIIIVQADNVGSNQIQKCRKALQKSSILIMGKNSIIKKVLKKQIEKNPNMQDLYDFTTGNVGLIFTKNDPFEIKKILKENRIPAPAKVGQIAQNEVIIPAGPTELPPDGTSFFQALNIPTKIQKGQIEIQDPIKLIEKGKVVGNSEAALLKKLNIVPFSFELQIKLVFDTDVCYKPTVLEITKEQLTESSLAIFSKLNLVAYSISYPTRFTIKNTIKKISTNLTLISHVIGYKPPKKNDYDDKNPILEKNKEEFPKNEPENDIQEPKNNKEENEENSEEDFGLGLFD